MTTERVRDDFEIHARGLFASMITIGCTNDELLNLRRRKTKSLYGVEVRSDRQLALRTMERLQLM